ncbi:Vitamin K epoxide reductase family protein [Posidoniimonas corsicana]|uniref:Vitamin K epoxide reductase family protein n=1 Tax=Posidoniimonas corsicana TaxID=1938618 RepID=A0A5C5V588_9BACT|nr:vitamin K epoxide reductase family protein [Posidoniimonas corsicana]TWT33471.1 Vitamin K epoxide reductase family protein [Posidoniimonas corsicana]
MPLKPELIGKLDAPVARFGYNPSAWSQRIPLVVLAMVAFVIATYMALYQWRLISGVWDPVFGDQTQKVLDSDVSHRMARWFRVPDAALGALAYLGDAIYGLAGSTRRWQYRPWMVILFGIDVIPLGIVSALLVGVQAFVLGDYCFPCIITAIISLILVYFAYDEVWASLSFLWQAWRRTRSPKVLWDAFWGRPSEQLEAIAQTLIGEKGRPAVSPDSIGAGNRAASS